MSEHIDWLTPSKRSRQYVNTIFSELNKDQVHVNTHVQTIQRVQQPDKSFQITVTSTRQNGGKSEEKTEKFDYVIFACHPDQTLTILNSEASVQEKALLGAFHYANNDTYVHCDEALMPKSKSAWTSWNYLGTTTAGSPNGTSSASTKPVFVTYWLNKLQNLANHPRDIFVSLNPTTPPKPEKTFVRLSYAHPQYSLSSVQAQKAISNTLQGVKSTFYCGAWMGYGFHEDGFRSGLEVAMRLSGVSVPWMKNNQFCTVENLGLTSQNATSKAKNASSNQVVKSSKNSTYLTTQGSRGFNTWGSLFARPLISLFATFCQQQVISFMKQGFDKGKLTLLLPYDNHRKVEICGKEAGEEVVVCIQKSSFFVRLALEADLGMARSYIAGNTAFLNVFLLSSCCLLVCRVVIAIWASHRKRCLLDVPCLFRKRLLSKLGFTVHCCIVSLFISNFTMILAVIKLVVLLLFIVFVVQVNGKSSTPYDMPTASLNSSNFSSTTCRLARPKLLVVSMSAVYSPLGRVAS